MYIKIKFNLKKYSILDLGGFQNLRGLFIFSSLEKNRFMAAFKIFIFTFLFFLIVFGVLTMIKKRIKNEELSPLKEFKKILLIALLLSIATLVITISSGGI